MFLIDEIQHLDTSELSALVMAKHRINRRALPLVIAGAGLPQLPGLTAEAQTYAERMFRWPSIGKLPAADARLALLAPAQREGVAFDEDALSYIVEYTEGYPYFLQEYGRAIWDAADGSPITLQDAIDTRPTVEAVLDQDFFAVRVAGLPDRELQYLQAMASLGPGEHAGADVAEALGRTAVQVASAQSRLIDRGLIYRARRGDVAFTVPPVRPVRGTSAALGLTTHTGIYQVPGKSRYECRGQRLPLTRRPTCARRLTTSRPRVPSGVSAGPRARTRRDSPRVAGEDDHGAGGRVARRSAPVG